MDGVCCGVSSGRAIENHPPFASPSLPSEGVYLSIQTIICIIRSGYNIRELCITERIRTLIIYYRVSITHFPLTFTRSFIRACVRYDAMFFGLLEDAWVPVVGDWRCLTFMLCDDLNLFLERRGNFFLVSVAKAFTLVGCREIRSCRSGRLGVEAWCLSYLLPRCACGGMGVLRNTRGHVRPGGLFRRLSHVRERTLFSLSFQVHAVMDSSWTPRMSFRY